MKSLTPNTTINFFCHVYLPQTGGIERYTASFSDQMVKLGYKVNIVTTDSHRLGSIDLQNNKLIFRFASINLIGRFPIPLNPAQVYKVYKYFFKDQDSLVVLNSRLFLTSLIGLFLGKISKSRIILIEHGSSHIEYSSRFLTKAFAKYEHFVSKIYKKAGVEFYGVSKASSQWLKHFDINSNSEIYNGVNIKKSDLESLKIDKSKKNITYVGRLIKEKGILELIKAFNEFSRSNKDYNLIIVGDGDLKNEVLKRSLDNSYIKYLGVLSHGKVLSLLSESNLFINPSNYAEGLPTTLLEAGYFGIPVITTPNGGAKEVIENGVNGVLIPRGESKYILEALQSFSDFEKEYLKLGANLAVTIKSNFIWRVIAKDFIEKISEDKTPKLFFNLDYRN